MKSKKIRTQADLARAVGTSRQNICKHMKRADAPPLNDVAGWIEFLAAHGREGSLPLEYRKQIAKQRVRLLKAQACRVEADNRRRAHEVVDFATVKFFLGQLMQLYFGHLDGMAQQFPASLKGLDEVAIHAAVKVAINRVRDDLRAKFTAWESGQEVPQ